jgi:amidohydrolase
MKMLRIMNNFEIGKGLINRMKETITEKELTEIFYWFHQHPELAYKEYETTKKIHDILQDSGINIIDLNLKTGLVAEIQGDFPGPVIALRSDIDALPIQEETELPYSSVIPNVMHACGHDFHTTVMLGAARLLQSRKHDIHGTIKIIFQPAEEAPGGAREIIETGVVKDAALIWGIHTTPALAVGTIGIRKGAVMAAVDRFSISIQGKGTHAGHPHKGIDPIVVTAAIVQAVQTIVSRNMNPFSAGLVSITHIESGNTWNIIPDKAFIEGTVRTMNLEDRVLFEQRLETIVKKTAEVYGAQADFLWFPGPPAVINDGQLCELAQKVAVQSGFCVQEAESSLGGEDFSLYLEQQKGAFLRIGTAGTYPNHHPKFTADEKALAPTAKYMAELAIASLEAVDIIKDRKDC